MQCQRKQKRKLKHWFRVPSQWRWNSPKQCKQTHRKTNGNCERFCWTVSQRQWEPSKVQRESSKRKETARKGKLSESQSSRRPTQWSKSDSRKRMISVWKPNERDRNRKETDRTSQSWRSPPTHSLRRKRDSVCELCEWESRSTL